MLRPQMAAYHAALEKVKGQRDRAFMTSVDGVKILPTSQVEIMRDSASTSLEAWKKFQQVYDVQVDNCTCPQFKTYSICKHSTAMKNFVTSNDVKVSASPPQRAPREDSTFFDVAASPPAYTTGQKPLHDISNTPQAPSQTPQWRSPKSVMYHPKERPLNTWQRKKEDL